MDTLGHLLALVVTPANEQERAQVDALAKQVQQATAQSVELAYVDQGYTGKKAAGAAAAHGIQLEVVKLADAKRGFLLLPRRWVVAENTPGLVYQFARRADGSAEFPFVSSARREILELEPETLQRDASEYFKRVHPEDAPERDRVVAESLVTLKLDITERKHADARLRMLENSVEHANDAILVTEAFPIDEPGPRIIYANRVFTEITGYPQAEILGRSPRFLQGLATRPAAKAKIRAALERRETMRIELINYRKDGSQFWVNSTLCPSPMCRIDSRIMCPCNAVRPSVNRRSGRWNRRATRPSARTTPRASSSRA